MRIVPIALRHLRQERGLATVEFSLVLLPFLMLVFGMVDLGRGVFTYTATGQAAREISRAVSLHPYGAVGGLGQSPEAQAAIEVHTGCTAWPATIGCGRGQVPGLMASGLTIDCVDIRDRTVTTRCQRGSFVRVVVGTRFELSTFIASAIGPIDLASGSHARIP